MRHRSGERTASGWPWVAFYNNPHSRQALYQAALLIVLVGLGYEVVVNARANLQAQGFASGFGFLHNTAGFGINQSLIPYNEGDTYGRVFVVGLLNTLVVAVIGIVLSTLLGVMVGIARLSPNWLMARLATGYVELIRNLPLLFQILFWYLAVLGALPGPRQSLGLFGMLFLNNRGIILPALAPQPGSIDVLYAAAAGAALAFCFWRWQRRRAASPRLPVAGIVAALLIGPPLATFVALGFPVGIDKPELRGFNFVGGLRLIPEFVALVVALTMYTAAFIAEVVRAGILAVGRGQSEAALALGLTRGQMLRLVVLPQALRVIVPPLTNQYLNLTKNSSLAVAIGYPDLFAVFAGTTLNQTNQAIEIIAITMAVYLALSLLTSALMNWYNARIRLTER